MLKNISNLGKTLSKTEQININGGVTRGCNGEKKRCQNHCCPSGYCCGSDPYNCVLAENGGSNCR